MKSDRIKPSKLDRVLSVERHFEAVDDYGIVDMTWGQHNTLRAELVDHTTDEAIRAHGASTERTLIFRTWFVDDITVADRIIYDGEPHNITQIREIGRRRALEITTERIGP